MDTECTGSPVSEAHGLTGKLADRDRNALLDRASVTFYSTQHLSSMQGDPRIHCAWQDAASSRRLSGTCLGSVWQ